MLKSILNYFKKTDYSDKLEYIQMSLGRIESFNQLNQKIERLSDAEFQIFSQGGEDGIIQYLTHKIKINNKVFVEFGVENYLESNTRFLLKKIIGQG